MSEDLNKHITTTHISSNSIDVTPLNGGVYKNTGGVYYSSPGYSGGGYTIGTPPNPDIDVLKGRVSMAEVNDANAAVKINELENQNREQRELIDVLTQGLTEVRGEIEGISEGVKKLVGERDYWKEIAQNLEIQRQALLEEENERLTEDDTE